MPPSQNVQNRPPDSQPMLLQLAPGRAAMLLTVICLLFIGLAAAYNYITPFTTPAELHGRDGGAANADEPAHLLYIQALAGGHLPVFSSSSPAYEDHQPPLYYVTALPVYLAVEHLLPDQQVHAIRWVNTVLGTVLIVMCFFSVRLIFPKRDDLSLLTSAIVAFLPMNISLAASISNDTLTNLLIVCLIWLTLSLLRNTSYALKISLVSGIVLGVAFWCKSSTVLIVPFIAASLLLAVSQKLLTPRLAALCLATSSVAAVVTAAPWLYRNTKLYGDPAAQSVLFHALAARNVSPDLLIQHFGGAWYQQRLIGWTFDSYWGVFDSMTLFLPAAIYIGIAVAVAAAYGLCIWKLRQASLDPVQKVVVTSSIFFALLVLLAFVQYNNHFFQTQGRYLYPALVPLTLFAAIGISDTASPRFRSGVLIAVSALMLLLNGWTLSIISGHFAS